METSGNSLNPYTIIKSKIALEEMMNIFYSKNLADNKTISSYAQDLHDVANDRRHAADGL